MRLGNLSEVAELRPVDTFSTSTMVAMSSPWATPNATASDVAASAVADKKLLANFIAWPRPARSPTWKTLPVNDCSNARWASSTSTGPANINEIVLARAPAAPPDTGPSQYVTPTDCNCAAASVAAFGPMVDRSMTVSTTALSVAQICCAIASVAAPSGTLINSVEQRLATSPTDAAGTAPAGISASVPAMSKHTRSFTAAATLAAIGPPIFPSPM